MQILVFTSTQSILKHFFGVCCTNLHSSPNPEPRTPNLNHMPADNSSHIAVDRGLEQDIQTTIVSVNLIAALADIQF